MASGYIIDCQDFIAKLDNACRQLDDAVTELSRISEKCPQRMIGDRAYIYGALIQLDTIKNRIEAAQASYRVAAE